MKFDGVRRLDSRLSTIPEAERIRRREQNDREIFELGKVLETYEIRFTRSGAILTLDPTHDKIVYKFMARNHLKLLLKEKYREAGFSKRGKELDRFVEF